MEREGYKMKVKIRNWIDVAVQLVVGVLVFLPNSYSITIWFLKNIGVWVPSETEGQVAFYAKVRVICPQLGWVLLVSMAIVLILFVVQLFGKGRRRNLACAAYAPVVELILFAIYATMGETSHDNISPYVELEPCWLFYVIFGLVIVTALFSVISYYIVKKAGAAALPADDDTGIPVDRLDNIKKLKDLLDCGAITEAEYEEKKQGLLK